MGINMGINLDGFNNYNFGRPNINPNMNPNVNPNTNPHMNPNMSPNNMGFNPSQRGPNPNINLPPNTDFSIPRPPVQQANNI